MARFTEQTPGALAIEFLDAVRIARLAGGLLIEHAALTAELAHLELEQEGARLKKVLLAMQLVAMLIGLTLLHLSALAIATAWDTPYRLRAIGALVVLFAAASFLVWRLLGRLSGQREQRFVASREELRKTIELLKSHL